MGMGEGSAVRSCVWKHCANPPVLRWATEGPPPGPAVAPPAGASPTRTVPVQDSHCLAQTRLLPPPQPWVVRAQGDKYGGTGLTPTAGFRSLVPITTVQAGGAQTLDHQRERHVSERKVASTDPCGQALLVFLSQGFDGVCLAISSVALTVQDGVCFWKTRGAAHALHTVSQPQEIRSWSTY